MKTYFHDHYETPKEAKRKFIDKLLLNSRVYFVYRYLDVIFKARKLAVKGKYDNEAWMESSYNTIKAVEDCGGTVNISGLENITACEGPFVFVGNHMSTLETFALPCLIAPHRSVTYVVKESLVTHPLFGPVMRSRNPIVVKRANPREDFEKVMNEGKDLLSQGISVIIFPQSTRSIEFNPENFNTLGVKLAKAAGVKVIPIALKTDFWGNGKILKDVGPVDRNKPVYIKFGQPLDITGNGKDEHKRIISFITENLINWGGKVIEQSV